MAGESKRPTKKEREEALLALYERWSAAWPDASIARVDSSGVEESPAAPWKVTLRHTKHPGRRFTLTLTPEGSIRELHVAAPSGGVGNDAESITATERQRWPLGYLRDAAHAYVRMSLEILPPDERVVLVWRAPWSEGYTIDEEHFPYEPRTAVVEHHKETQEAWEHRDRPGRAGRNDAEYAHDAAAYVRHLATSRTPLIDLAAELHVSPAQARTRLNQARHRGLLTSAPKGRAGGNLTDTALALLKEARDGTR